MKTNYFPRLILAILMIFTIGIGIGQTQEENLLTNPGFEDGFDSSQVANGWESWVSDDEDAPDFQESPTYLQASDASDNGLIPQVRSGDEAQALFSFFASHDAGIYQQVDDITEGSELRFSIYGHVFSNSTADVDQSTNPGGVTIRVGIDPTGGTDPFSDDIVYTEPFITYDTFIQYNVIATAESDTATVFVRSTVTEPVQNTIVFLDDAVLNVTPESSVPAETEEPTEEPTEVPTEETIEEPTPTREVSDEPTDEPTEEPTDEPTDEPTEEPTEEPTAEPTDEIPISEEFPGQITHTVVRGDTVGQLATLYGSSVNAIISVNGLDDSALIFVEQELIIPVRIVPGEETPVPTTAAVTPDDTSTNQPVASGTQYTVAPGDSLSSIARRFNTTVGALVQLNGITNPNRILVGQILNLPGSGDSATPVPTNPAPTPIPTQVPDTPTTYVIQPGDNLYRIALRNGISLTDLAEANNITNFNLIFIGQTLTLP